jgi:fluoroacetyl-CoA thioesterase
VPADDLSAGLTGELSAGLSRELSAGLSREATYKVTPDMTPPHLDDVLATSRMISLVEDTCLAAAQPFLAAGQTTVGTHVNVSHVGTARPGDEVTVRVRLDRVTQRRLLSFAVEVAAPGGIISTGSHQRLVIERSRLARR